MISHPHRCIFIHIPKTAGNSVNRVFGVQWQDHKDLQRYAGELEPEIFAGYFKFAIVRNPWDRIFSDYNYQLKKSREKASKLHAFRPDGSKRNFAEWLEATLAAPDAFDPGQWGGEVSPHIHRWSPQVDWLSVRGQLQVDYVARMENLRQDFAVVSERVGLPKARLPYRNRRLHWHYSSYYDRQTRDLVASCYARDIEEFGYDFEEACPLLRIIAWPGRKLTAPAEPKSRQRHAGFALLPFSAGLIAAGLAVLFAVPGRAVVSDDSPAPTVQRLSLSFLVRERFDLSHVWRGANHAHAAREDRAGSDSRRHSPNGR